MPEFEIIDLTAEAPATTGRAKVGVATAQGLSVGRIDTAEVAASLEALRKDISEHVAAPGKGLRVTNLVLRLTLSAEGRVAFIAKGAAEACIEVTFAPAT